MTSLKTQKRKKIRFLETLIGAGLALTVFLDVSFYNENVNLTGVIADREQELKTLLAGNADLKNRLYELTDGKNLEPLAAKLGLVKTSRPEYLETNYTSFPSVSESTGKKPGL